jgi:enoyl-CoA hydratase/carnithine racemase
MFMMSPPRRVIVFTTTGKHFSAGHDMSGSDPSANGRSLRPRRAEDGKLVAEEYYDWETRGYLEYAKRWRDIPKPALRMAKRAVNHTLDTMGFSTAIASCFDMHHLGHTRALAATGGRTVVMADLDRMKAAGQGS